MVILFFFAGIYLGSAFVETAPALPVQPATGALAPSLRRMGLPNTFNILEKWEENIASEIAEITDPLKNMLRTQNSNNDKNNNIANFNQIPSSNLRGSSLSSSATGIPPTHTKQSDSSEQVVSNNNALPKAVAQTVPHGGDIAGHSIGVYK